MKRDQEEEMKGQWSGGKVSASGSEGSKLETDYTKDQACIRAPCTPGPNAPPSARRGNLDREAPAQPPPPRLKITSLSQNSPRVESKREVYNTKLNQE
ncbi:hypothetical protein AVEN_28883-1 [Araneus ventricosus]|uniref:Uncharacterized protein n=1 Tax=Araneus ventricosus TaxID=182803 RepID=A0A4Y2AKP3_ARAVE|nr:hypothetical protein AVEN_28883-1 [Araneus ventricosus]